MTYPEEALPAVLPDRLDWPVTLTTGETVPFDVLVTTWALLTRRLTTPTVVALLLCSAKHTDVDPTALRLLRLCGLVTVDGVVDPDVRKVIAAAHPEPVVAQAPGRKGTSVVAVRWTVPAVGLG